MKDKWKEIWKNHPTCINHEGSNFARVYNKTTDTFFEGHVDKRGYTMLHLRQYDNLRISLHKFIFECFSGLVDSTIYDIHHIDDDKSKKNYNYLSNLQMLTRDEHNKITHNGRVNKNPHTIKVIRIKLDDNDYEISREIFESVKELQKLGFTAESIKDCAEGKIKKYRGYKFEYILDDIIPDEIWVSLREEKYNKQEVSNYGRFRRNGRITIGHKDAAGYYIKQIGQNEYKAHFLICLAFLGNVPTKEHTPDHIDKNIANNLLVNLRWSTKKEQSMNSTNVKKVQAYDIKTGEIFKTWDSQREAGKELNIGNPSNIGIVCRNTDGKSKTCAGYKWRFVD